MDFGPLVPASESAIRELHAEPKLTSAGRTGPRLYSNPPSHESALGESMRILRKRKWIVIGSLATIFSVVAIASLKMPKVYEANAAPSKLTSPIPV